MDFLIDVHLPIKLSKYLDSISGCSSIHVNQILQKWNTSDDEICSYADKNSLVVITKDRDFKNSHFVNGTPKKVVRITLGNVSNNDLLKLFKKYLHFILQLSEKEKMFVEMSSEQLTIIES